MSTVGIIAEYNPIHNGHIYNIKKAKELSNAENVVVIMSGSFTQNGNIAIYDKFTRANLAKSCGADLVIELPTIYACSSANYFAFGAINILDKLNIVDSICFGSEEGNIDEITDIAKTIVNFEDKILETTLKNLKNGTSFAVSRASAINSFSNKDLKDTLNKPNNILGIEYVTNLLKQKSSIVPYCIKREGNDFNDENINSNQLYISATTIRNCIKRQDIEVIKNYVPTSCFNVISNEKPLFNDMIFDLLKYKIVTSSKEDLKNIFEVNEGLENKIISEISNSKNYKEFVENIKSKRYQLSKIQRMLINILLNITKKDFDLAYQNNLAYAHVLACSNNGKKLLSMLSKKSSIPIITSVNDKVVYDLNELTKKNLKLDILASNIYSTLKNDCINKDYTNRI